MWPLVIGGSALMGFLGMSGASSAAEQANKNLKKALERLDRLKAGLVSQDIKETSEQSQLQRNYADRAFMSINPDIARSISSQALGSMESYRNIKTNRSQQLAHLVQSTADMELNKQDPYAAGMMGFLYGAGSGLNMGSNMYSMFQ